MGTAYWVIMIMKDLQIPTTRTSGITKEEQEYSRHRYSGLKPCYIFFRLSWLASS